MENFLRNRKKPLLADTTIAILFGPDPLRPDFSLAELIQIFDAAKINTAWTLNIQAKVWKKFIFICAYGLVSATFNKTLGEILEDETPRILENRKPAPVLASEAVACQRASSPR